MSLQALRATILFINFVYNLLLYFLLLDNMSFKKPILFYTPEIQLISLPFFNLTKDLIKEVKR